MKKSTIIKFPTKEKDIHAKYLLELGYKYRIFTMENTPGLLQCEIEDMPDVCLYHYGRSIQLMVEMEQSNERLKRFPFNIL